MSHNRTSRASGLARFFLLTLLALTLAAPLAVGSASASTVTGAPSLSSAYVVGHNSAIVFVGAESWAAVWTSEGNGTQIYSDALILVAFDIRPYNVTLDIDAYQATHGWVSNQSVPLIPFAQTNIIVPFVSDPDWRNVVVLMDGTPYYCQIATPISLLPPNILNVGGLDILALGIVSEGIITFAGMTALAKVLMRRARWAPKFSLLIWGHVVIIGILALVVINYEWVDRTFAGWSPLVYVFAAAPMVFLFSLSLFNQSEKAEVLQRLAKPQGRILYRRWLVRFSVLRDGRTVLVDERWRGWLARLLGHHVVIDKGDEFEPVPFEGDVVTEESPTGTRTFSGRIADRFKIQNPQDDGVTKLWWTDTGDPVLVDWPKWTIHRLKHIEAKLSPEGNVLVKEHDELRLSLPHYTQEHVELHRALEDFRAAEAVSAGWVTIRDMARVLSKVKTDLYVLKANFSAQVEKEKEAALVAYYSLLGKTSADLTDEEAENMARKGTSAPSLSELLDEVSLRAPEPRKKEKGGKS